MGNQHELAIDISDREAKLSAYGDYRAFRYMIGTANEPISESLKRYLRQKELDEFADIKHFTRDTKSGIEFNALLNQKFPYLICLNKKGNDVKIIAHSFGLEGLIIASDLIRTTGFRTRQSPFNDEERMAFQQLLDIERKGDLAHINTLTAIGKEDKNEIKRIRVEVMNVIYDSYIANSEDL